MPYVGRDLQRGNYLKLDDISSSFDGSTTTFNLTSGGNAFFPGSAFSIIVSLGGVIQEPESAFQIDKSQIIFAQAPTPNDDFFCIVQGVALGVGVPGHNTVGNNQLAKPLSYSDYFRWDSANNRVGINTLLPSVDLDVVGDASFSGNVSIGGTLTYEDVANIDAVGIITARAGIEDKTLTSGRIVYTGSGGRLVDNSNLTYSGTSIGVPQIVVGSALTANSTGVHVSGVSTFRGEVQLTNGNQIKLSNNTNSASATIDCDGGARLHLKSYSQSVATFEEGVGTIFYQSSGTARLTISPTGGIVVGAGGTIIIPDKIMHVGDEDTSIRFPAADTITFETADDERLRITPTGQLLLGINNAVDAEVDLQIHSATSGNGPILNMTNNTGDCRIFFGQDNSSGSANAQGQLRYNVASNYLTLYTAGDERLRIASNGNIETGSASGTGSDFSLLDGIIINAGNGMGGLMVNSSSSSHNAYISFSYGSGSSTSHADQFSAYIGRVGDDTLIFGTQNNLRWKIDSSGHFLPGAVGTYDIGSTGAEIGDVYLADNKRLKLGSDQDMFVYHDNIHGYVSNRKANLYLQAPNYVEIGSTDTSGSATQTSARFLRGGKSEIYHSDSVKFETSGTGITVTGEVAASQDYPQSDPNIDFVFTRTKKLDPRLTYKRSGSASYVDKNGMIKMVGDNVPRFDHDPLTKECKGLLLEPAAYNRVAASTSGIPNVPYGIYSTNSNVNGDKTGISADTLAPDGSKWTFKVSWKGATFSANGYYRVGVLNLGTLAAGDYTVSCFVKRGIDGNHNIDTLFDGSSPLGNGQYHFSSEQYSPSYVAASANWVTDSDVKIEKFQNGWYRVSAPFTVSTTFSPMRTGMSHYVLNSSGHETYYKEHDWYYWGFQIEAGDVATSFIGTFSGDSTSTDGERLRAQRGADCLFMNGQEFKDFYNVVESSVVMQYSHYTSSTNVGTNARPFKIFASTGSDTRIDYVSTHNFHPYIAADGNVIVGSGGLDAGTPLYDGQTNKIAVKVKHQDFASTINGGTVVTNTSGSWPPTNKMDLLTLGTLNKDGGGVLNGHIQRFTYYPVGLTNNQLVTLTS